MTTKGPGSRPRVLPQPGDREFVRDAAFNAIRFAHVMTANWPAFNAVPRVVRPVAGDRPSLLTAVYQSFVLGVAELTQARTAERSSISSPA